MWDLSQWLKMFLAGLTTEKLHSFIYDEALRGYKIGLEAGYADANDGTYKEGSAQIDKDAIEAIGARTHILSESTIADAKKHLAMDLEKLYDELNGAIRGGMSEREALRQIQDRVQGLFTSAFPDWKLERLVRDQFIVATKEGRRMGWEKNGMLYRQWVMHRDSHTGDDSKRMHGQITGINEPYTDPLDGKQYMLPHMRPNDRCYEKPLKELPKNIVRKNGIMYVEA